MNPYIFVKLTSKPSASGSCALSVDRSRIFWDPSVSKVREARNGAVTQFQQGTLKEVYWDLLGKVSSWMKRDPQEERERVRMEPEGVMNKEAEQIGRAHPIRKCQGVRARSRGE